MIISIYIMLLILFLVMFFHLPVVCRIVVTDENKDNYILIQIMHGFIKTRYNFAIERDTASIFKIYVSNANHEIIAMRKFIEVHNDFQLARMKLKQYTPFITYLLSKLWLKSFDSKIQVGVKQSAAITALVYGIISASVFSLIQFSSLFVRCKHKAISVVPLFDRSIFLINLNCIFCIKAGYIMIVILKIWIKKYKKRCSYGTASN